MRPSRSASSARAVSVRLTTVVEILARTLVDHHRDDGGQRLAIFLVNDGLASARTIMASASARTAQPRLRVKASNATSTTATASAAHST